MTAKNAEPVSRFWACFFSSSILGIYWTQKMKKTRKLILIIILVSCMYYTSMILPLDNDRVDSMLEGLFSIVIFVFILSSLIISLILPIYFMYKWTTEYNLKMFSYKSKKEWKKIQ